LWFRANELRVRGWGSGYRIFGLLVLNYGFLVSRLWVPGYWIWDLGSGIWDMRSGIYVLDD
jgi:hypothetical protein